MNDNCRSQYVKCNNGSAKAVLTSLFIFVSATLAVSCFLEKNDIFWISTANQRISFFFWLLVPLAMVALKNLVKGLEDKNAELEVKYPGKITDTKTREYLFLRDHSLPCDHFLLHLLPRRPSIVNFALLSERNKQTHMVSTFLTL